MVRKAMWLGCWWASALLVGCGGASAESSPQTAADMSVGYAAQGMPPPDAPAETRSAHASAGEASAARVEFSDQELVGGGQVVLTSGSVPVAEPKPAPKDSPARGAPSDSDKKRDESRSAGRLAQNSPEPQSPPGTTPPSQPKKEQREQRADVEAVAQPMLVYTATMTMAVFEVKKSLADVEALSREVGGFLARRTDQNITIRVPVARFDETIARLEKMGDVVARNVTAEDVTEEFFDLEVRLKSSRAVRDRLEQLLQKATKVEDSVLIERELTRVVGEIERIEGRMKFLRDRASYSTITVDFRPRGNERVGNGPFNLPVPWLSELGLRRLLNL